MKWIEPTIFACLFVIHASAAATTTTKPVILVTKIPAKNAKGQTITSPVPNIIEQNGVPIAIAFPDEPHPLVKPSAINSPTAINIAAATTSLYVGESLPRPSDTSDGGDGLEAKNSSNSATATESDSEETDAAAMTYDAMIKAHGSLMFLAWGVFAPSGIVCARYYKFTEHGAKRWFPLHMFFFVSCFVCTVASFVIVYKATGEDHFDYSQNGLHVVLGLAVVVLVFKQLASGFIINKLFNPSRTAVPWWDQLHHWIGRLGFVGALVNIPLGLSLYGTVAPIWILYQLWLMLIVAIFAFLEGRRRYIPDVHRGEYIQAPGSGSTEVQAMERGVSDVTLLEGVDRGVAPEKKDARPESDNANIFTIQSAIVPEPNRELMQEIEAEQIEMDIVKLANNPQKTDASFPRKLTGVFQGYEELLIDSKERQSWSGFPTAGVAEGAEGENAPFAAETRNSLNIELALDVDHKKIDAVDLIVQPSVKTAVDVANAVSGSDAVKGILEEVVVPETREIDDSDGLGSIIDQYGSQSVRASLAYVSESNDCDRQTPDK
ncbi:hypothetical protein HDU99_000304 [Rhizoclosmatium hyalinum]|nr:hypothetical protein HDU99_000304 [Rhizoclosmatium hyalinum]